MKFIRLDSAMVTSLEHFAGSAGRDAPRVPLFYTCSPTRSQKEIYTLEATEETVEGLTEFLRERLAREGGHYFGTLTLREIGTRWGKAVQNVRA